MGGWEEVPVGMGRRGPREDGGEVLMGMGRASRGFREVHVGMVRAYVGMGEMGRSPADEEKPRVAS